MKLSVIIPTKDRNDIFQETLQAACLAIKDLDAEIIVINDSPLSLPILPENCEHIKLYNNPKSGVASARNFGVQMSSGQLILFLDNDIIISKFSIEHIIMLHINTPNACFNLNWIYPPELKQKLHKSSFGRFLVKNNMTSFKGWYGSDRWHDSKLFISTSVASFHLSIYKTDFLKTGGYNESFEFAGFEDYDFPLKIKKCGILTFIDSSVTVYHNESDRLNLDNWFMNQKLRSITRKSAVKMGYENLKLNYSWPKKHILSIVSSSNVLNNIAKSWPNILFLDPIYFKLISILQASKIYEGYTESKP